MLLDMHNHTISSGHAYSTVEEIVREADRTGLEYVGITDHGPEMPGGPYIFHIGNLKVLPEKIGNVNILKGVEANILTKCGELDLPESILENLDLVIASLHDVCIAPMSREDNTKALIEAIKNPYVDIIGHPGNPLFPINEEEFVLAAKKENVLVEINNSSFVSSRLGSYDNCKRIAILCREHEVPVIINSDSHFSMAVGKFDEALELLREIKMPEDLIVNTDPEKFIAILRQHGKKRFL